MRRTVGGFAAPVLGLLLALPSTAGADERPRSPVASPPTVARLLEIARERRWDTLAVGAGVVRFGRALEGAPYLERTLEGPGPETCRVTTQGFDCVTFIEVCLNLARTVRMDLSGRDPAPADLQDAVTHTRYRGGRLSGYASRLHYTAEWIADNVEKGVVEDVTPSLGGVRHPIRVGFMSAHPELYPALQAEPALVDSMRRIERRINAIPRTFVPKERVAAIEPKLETGDIIAITTSVAGLDYSHTGLIFRDAKGVARFLHASSSKGRVVLDERISRYLSRGPKSNTGITVLRPVEP